MKRKGLFLLLTVILVLTAAAAFADVAIDETNFPDSEFRHYVKAFFDLDGNGSLSDAEIAEAKTIELSVPIGSDDDDKVSDLTGVEHFTALEKLYVDNNLLTSLDVSKNTALKTLQCSINRLTSLNVTKTTALTHLFADNNPLTGIDVSRNTELLELWVNGTQMTKLDISAVPNLRKLVLETEPTESGDNYIWEMPSSEGSVYDVRLKAKKTVKIITDEEQTDISEAEIDTIPDQVYTGKAIKPKITVRYEGNVLVNGTDYTVSYQNNKMVGVATVTVTGKGECIGSQTTNFVINPPAVKLLSLKAGKKMLTVTWKKGKVKAIDGYHVEYSLKSNFKNAVRVNIIKPAVTKTELKFLKVKKYFVRVRTYKKTRDNIYYSAWSNVLSQKPTK